MGEARRREESESGLTDAERAEWADDVMADVLALEAAAIRAVAGEGADPTTQDAAGRIATLHMLSVIRSIGSSVEGLVGDEDADDEEPPGPAEPFSLVTTPPRRPAPPVLPE